jgi:hypothetical protein
LPEPPPFLLFVFVGTVVVVVEVGIVVVVVGVVVVVVDDVGSVVVVVVDVVVVVLWTTPDWDDVDDAEPDELIAVTLTSSEKPTTPVPTPNDDDVAPRIGVQIEDTQLSH